MNLPEITVKALPVTQEVILTWLSFGVLLFIASRFLFKPVTQFLEKRGEAIAKDISEAKDSREDAMALKEEYELKIQEAKKEGQEIIEAAKKRGEELRVKIVEEANDEAKGIVEKARREIESEREKAVDDLKAEVVTIAMMAASKVVDENLDVNSHKKLINEFISEVGEGKWQN
ncbi:F0F1 ATP synthase subunit B [Sporosalibacterium faouarense]|uniref:F0F1 ATP synthase subunit B n=1 Tax=Sporosalibacterium faouarense TaxID=516123 RepID=UPI00141C2CE8|nr:F0F1 ATP synthase subunit B [Sporosalibacterium faouarense]MTI46866.1 F0F1 ATP synthase subunit B [Bacillota bacterium]